MEFLIGTLLRKLNKSVRCNSSIDWIFWTVFVGPEISVDVNNENTNGAGEGTPAAPREGENGVAASNKASLQSATGNAAAPVAVGSSGGVKVSEEGVSGREESDNKEGGQRRSIISSIR